MERNADEDDDPRVHSPVSHTEEPEEVVAVAEGSTIYQHQEGYQEDDGHVLADAEKINALNLEGETEGRDGDDNGSGQVHKEVTRNNDATPDEQEDQSEEHMKTGDASADKNEARKDEGDEKAETALEVKESENITTEGKDVTPSSAQMPTEESNSVKAENENTDDETVEMAQTDEKEETKKTEEVGASATVQSDDPEKEDASSRQFRRDSSDSEKSDLPVSTAVEDTNNTEKNDQPETEEIQEKENQTNPNHL